MYRPNKLLTRHISISLQSLSDLLRRVTDKRKEQKTFGKIVFKGLRFCNFFITKQLKECTFKLNKKKSGDRFKRVHK